MLEAASEKAESGALRVPVRPPVSETRSLRGVVEPIQSGLCLQRDTLPASSDKAAAAYRLLPSSCR